MQNNTLGPQHFLTYQIQIFLIRKIIQIYTRINMYFPKKTPIFFSFFVEKQNDGFWCELMVGNIVIIKMVHKFIRKNKLESQVKPPIFQTPQFFEIFNKGTK
jgi:hypothetical protein